MRDIQCPYCDAKECVDGALLGWRQVGFQPDPITFLTMKTSIRVGARVCKGCGHIDLFCDPVEAQALSAEKKAS